MSRNVHITVLNQKTTKKVTAQPIIAPTYPDIAPNGLDEDVGEAAAIVSIKIEGIPLTGQLPLSEKRFQLLSVLFALSRFVRLRHTAIYDVSQGNKWQQ